MKDKEKGLFQKYQVTKLTNPTKKMDCIVLEFDDEISRVGIEAFADECSKRGYHNLAHDIYGHLHQTDRANTEKGCHVCVNRNEPCSPVTLEKINGAECSMFKRA